MYSVAVVKSACFEHSNFFTVNDLGPGAFEVDAPPSGPSRQAAPCTKAPLRGILHSARLAGRDTASAKRPAHNIPTKSIAGMGIQKEGAGGPVHAPVLRRTEPTAPRDPTTSFLTATTLIYAIGAGITAAAGTRLALQLLLDKGFKLFSFQLQDQKALHCYFLSLPPCVRIG
jgi:hypothetical protein